MLEESTHSRRKVRPPAEQMELDTHFIKGQLVIDIYEVKLQERPKHSKKTNFKRMLCQKDFKKLI